MISRARTRASTVGNTSVELIVIGRVNCLFIELASGSRLGEEAPRLTHVAPRMAAAPGSALRKRPATNAHFSNSASMSAANDA